MIVALVLGESTTPLARPGAAAVATGGVQDGHPAGGLPL
jgi:hypothetical protein